MYGFYGGTVRERVLVMRHRTNNVNNFCILLLFLSLCIVPAMSIAFATFSLANYSYEQFPLSIHLYIWKRFKLVFH